ncbi:Small subunit (SSU) processome component [Lobaria immixta]|nr:Small subunit (SSU) processome component [Lobaria immixta]
MVSKKSSRGAASKVSSSAAPASSSATQTASKSSILKSLFLPSRYQLSLFASIIQGLDSQHVRVHDTSTGKLRCEHAIGSKATINCLDWGYYGNTHRDQHVQESGKKRKRRKETNGHDVETNARDIVLAVGTSDSEINLYSVTKAKIVKVLKGPHTQGIKDFKFTVGGRTQEGWSIGGDGKFIHWDLLKGTILRSLQVPARNPTVLHPLPSAMIFAAQHTAYLLDFDFDKPTPFTASVHPVHTIISSSSDSTRPFSFLTAAESDRFMTVFDNVSDQSNGLLCTENEIMSADLYSGSTGIGKAHQDELGQDLMLRPEQVLLAVNKDGTLEIFSSPFTFGSTLTPKETGSRKAQMKQRTRKANALVKIIRPDKSHTAVPLLGASFQGNDIVMAWTEGGINLIFHRIPFREEESGEILVMGRTEITKGKGGASIGAAVMNGVKDMGRNHVDESHTVVMNGGVLKDEEMASDQPEIIDISSGEEDSEYEEEDSVHRQIAEGSSSSEEDTEMQDAGNDNGGEIERLDHPSPARAEDVTPEGDESEEPPEPQTPSFGELLRANAPEPVDVQAAFAVPDEQALAPAGERGLDLPSGMSLGTVLTQSLRTNDVKLLETCFHVKDLSIVRATVERLDSSLATVLLQRLAERLHSRPGRAGSLMVWVQWTLVAHGGYLANQPELMKKLTSLYQVVKDRANSLQSLLSLKGKLDMLEAQLSLRKSMQARSRALNALNEEEEEGVIYVEGQEESDSESEVADHVKSGHIHPGKGVQHDSSPIGSDEEVDEENEDEDEGDDMPTTTNGINLDDSSEATDSEGDGLIDDEASSTDHDSDDEASSDIVDHESVDSPDSAALSEPEAPPAKRLSKAKLSNGVGTRKG